MRTVFSLFVLLLLLSGCASAPAGPELRYCAQLRTGDVISLSAEPLVASEIETPELPVSERVTLHVRRPSGRMIETVIGWGIDCSDLQVRTDPAQSCVWVVNTATKEVLASHVLLSAGGVTNGEPPSLPGNGGFVLVNSLTGSGQPAGAGGGVRGILAGRVSRSCSTGSG